MGETLRAGAFVEHAMDAWGALVYRIALNQTHSPHDADDVTQDVFLKLLHDATPFESDEHLKAWLIRVTVNCCKELRRSVWKRRVDTTETSSPELANLEAPVQALTSSEVWEAVQRLPKQMRLAVHLHYLEGCSVDEIARLTHCNPSTVRTRLHRARKKLKLALEEEADNEASREQLPFAHERR